MTPRTRSPARPTASPARMSAGDGFEQDLYQAELDDAIADLDGEAQDVRDDAPEVEQAFWDGFESTFETA